MQSVYHYKHQVDILTSPARPVYLSDVLYNDVALGYFMQVHACIFDISCMIHIYLFY